MSDMNLDALVIIAFGRDSSSVSDLWSQGGMDVHIVMANRDLMIPELDNGKQSRTAFALLTAPDLTVLQTPRGMLRVRVNGLDVYNSKTGQVEPADSRRVSCMMVDTDFNGESFFARRINLPNVTKRVFDNGRWERGRLARNARRADRSSSNNPVDSP